MDIKKQLITHSKNCPEKPAILFNAERISFLELKDNCFRFANFALSLGLTKSDKVAIFLPNNLEAVFSYLGVLSFGATLVPFDFMLTEEEIIHFINHSESKLLVTQPKKGIDFRKIKESCPSLIDVVVCKERIEGFSFWDDLIPQASGREPCEQVTPDDLSSILYTSGSTGHPKGVMLNFSHLDNCPQSMNHFLRLSTDDVILCGGVPFSHLGGFDYFLVMLDLASTLVLIERFNPLEVLRSIERHNVTFSWMVPPMYIALLSLKEADKLDLSSLRYLNVFGAPSSPALLRRFHQMCPNAHLFNGWGMTETAAPNCYMPPEFDNIASIGKFTPGLTPKIVDEEGNEQPRGKQGELWVKGEAVMAGYYKEPQLTREAITEDGWLKTGDIAQFDEQDLCYIVGRKKDMIKVGGEIVFSAEVEEKIHRHPKVKEVGVVGVSDKLRGEVPKAFIVAKEGESLDAEDLRQFLKPHLAHFKLPHHFEFLAELPKNRAGKIDKQFLRQVATEN